MPLYEIIIGSIGLSADIFAASVCKGLSIKKMKMREYLTVALWLTIFQVLMPFIGFLVGTRFSSFINKIDHWIAFVLLCFIGIKLLVEGLSIQKGVKGIISKAKMRRENMSLKVSDMLGLALATNVDATAYGVAYSLSYGYNNFYLCLLVTFICGLIFTLFGCFLGNKFGNKYEKLAKVTGGLILVALGVKILLEHLSIL